ncbi:MAG: hypothetical protein ACNA8W_03525 [Bradymonadaceae bacterium]
MKKFIAVLFIVALALPVAGCFHNQVITSPEYNPSKTVPDHEQSYLQVLGFVGITSPVQLNEVCPRGAGIVEHRMLFPTPLISFGQAKVYCQGAAADLSADGPVMAQLEE